MWDVQPTIENRLKIGHENKGALEHPWEDPKAWTTTTTQITRRLYHGKLKNWLCSKKENQQINWTENYLMHK